MEPNETTSLMYQAFSLHDEIDKVASKLNSDGSKVFGPQSLQFPKLIPAELGFLRVVSWFYILYFEIGKISVDFLNKRLSLYGLDNDGKTGRHLQEIASLRTHLYHSLDPRSKHDTVIQQTCDRLFLSYCNTAVPTKEVQWESCLIGLLKDCIKFLEGIRDCIRAIEQDETQTEILQEWEFRRNRYHPPHEFDKVIGITAADIGFDNIDIQRFRNRHYDQWCRELDQLSEYQFQQEARKRIERDLLSEMENLLPIDGHDIMEAFNIPPGPKIREFLAKARELHASSPCPKTLLLERLRDALKTEVPKSPIGAGIVTVE